MYFSFSALLLVVALTSSTAAQETAQEALLELSYGILCNQDKLLDQHLPGLLATVHVVNAEGQVQRSIRTLLPLGTQEKNLLLGPVTLSDQVRVDIEDHPACQLEPSLSLLNDMGPYAGKNFLTQIKFLAPNQDESPKTESKIDWQSIARRFSPAIIPREDQIQNPYTDIPLLLGFDYQALAGQEKRYQLRYTLIFSDEDSLKSQEELDQQMGRYGRRSDIEWVMKMEIEFDAQGEVILVEESLRFQGFLHSSQAFFEKKGRFLPNSQHPLIYNAAQNNIFSSTPVSPTQTSMTEGQTPLILHLLDPARSFSQPEARENLQFENPWICQISDAECRREGKLSQASSEFLYVKISGEFVMNKMQRTFKKLNPQIEVTLGAEAFISAGTVDRLGHDLYEQESIIAIAVGQRQLEEIEQGLLSPQLRLKFADSTVSLDPEQVLKINGIRYYRLKSDTRGFELRFKEIASQ